MVSRFFSYSHTDEGYRDELETHLAALKRQGVIGTWHDRRLGAGSEVDATIDGRLESSEMKAATSLISCTNAAAYATVSRYVFFSFFEIVPGRFSPD